MPRKPSNIIYAVDDRPPLGVVVALAVQHLFFLGVGLVFPVMTMRIIGATPEFTRSVVSLSMICAGTATIIQSLKRGPVGSGYLCAQGNDPTILAFSIMAGKMGGLPLILGMTVFSGLTECLLARLLHRMRTLFPSEVTGVILTMVGLTIVPYTMSQFFGVKENGGVLHGPTAAVGIITLAVICGINVWSKGKLRFYAVISGIVAGFVASYLFGILTQNDLHQLVTVPFVSLPDISIIGWSFSTALVIPVLVATLSSTLKSVATITMCQKINDADWKRPDMDNVGKGVMADGLASVLGGLFGGMGQSLYAATVGFSVATGVTSRIVARFMGGLFIAIAFFPKISMAYTIMPAPVIGAICLFTVSFMVISGIQIMMSRMIDVRKTFIIAISLVIGLSVDLFPDLYRTVHPWLAPLFSSSLAATTIFALGLNLLFRLGIASRATLELLPGGETADAIFSFMDSQGGKWGARREVIQKATGALNELYEAVSAGNLARGKLMVDALFDELNLELTIRYEGCPLEFPEAAPSREELLDDRTGVAHMAAFLIRRMADRVKVVTVGDSCTVHLHFEH